MTRLRLRTSRSGSNCSGTGKGISPVTRNTGQSNNRSPCRKDGPRTTSYHPSSLIGGLRRHDGEISIGQNHRVGVLSHLSDLALQAEHTARRFLQYDILLDV